MFKTIYVLKLDNSKYLKSLIKYQIHFIKIKYKDNACFLYVDDDNLKKIDHFMEIYSLTLVKILGLKKYELLIKKYYLFMICILMGIVLVYGLSNIIFDVKIMTNKQDLIKILERELSEFDLKKYRFAKSYNEKELIKEHILSDYKDKFEWIEIDRIGCKYYIHLLERIKMDNIIEYQYQNVVAKKNAVIKEIKASNGQIVQKVNDYVNRGDVIISGKIMKNEDVKNLVKASGTIYGETWYTVKVELPHTYKDWSSKSSYSRWTINFLNKKIFLFGRGKAQNIEWTDKVLFQVPILPISFNKTTIYDMNENTYFYTYVQAENMGMSLARERLLENLNSDSQILSQKKLKLYEENSKIIIEVFFKVYENITDYENIS